MERSPLYANVLEWGKHSNWIISKAFSEGRVDFPKCLACLFAVNPITISMETQFLFTLNCCDDESLQLCNLLLQYLPDRKMARNIAEVKTMLFILLVRINWLIGAEILLICRDELLIGWGEYFSFFSLLAMFFDMSSVHCYSDLIDALD